jgi:hypothetical protein
MCLEVKVKRSKAELGIPLISAGLTSPMGFRSEAASQSRGQVSGFPAGVGIDAPGGTHGLAAFFPTSVFSGSSFLHGIGYPSA